MAFQERPFPRRQFQLSACTAITTRDLSLFENYLLDNFIDSQFSS